MSVDSAWQKNGAKQSPDDKTKQALLGAIDRFDRGFVVEFIAYGLLPLPLPRIMRRCEKRVLRQRIESMLHDWDTIPDHHSYIEETDRLMREARWGSRASKTDAPLSSTVTKVDRRRVVTMLTNVLAPRTGEAMLGDLDEEFARRETSDGSDAARRWLRRQTTIMVLGLLCRFIVRGDAIVRAFEDILRIGSNLF